MSLKTRCPACDTVFKIVPDQLKVSKGWVRCGRCAEVFDAAAHAASADDVTLWPQTSAPATPPAAAAVAAVVKSTGASTPSIAFKKSNFAPNSEAVQAINTPHKTILPSKNELKKNESEASDLSFVRIAKNKAFWQTVAMTRTLRVACLGLAGLLVAQVVYDQRNHLAASNATLKSGLAAVCQTVNCTIEPYKDIDAFKIDSSSFQKASALSVDNAHAEAFNFKLSLKNNADMPLAMPAVELTLTEAGDKPVLRRVLTVKELGFSGATLAANGDWAGAATVAVTPHPAMAPISGYRVLLFYP